MQIGSGPKTRYLLASNTPVLPRDFSSLDVYNSLPECLAHGPQTDLFGRQDQILAFKSDTPDGGYNDRCSDAERLEEFTLGRPRDQLGHCQRPLIRMEALSGRDIGQDSLFSRVRIQQLEARGARQARENGPVQRGRYNVQI